MNRFMDSFDLYDTATMFTHWDVPGGGQIVPGGRTGNCLESSGINNGPSIKILDAQPTWIVGFALKWPGVGEIDVLTWLDGTNRQCHLSVVDASGKLGVFRDGTLLGGSGSYCLRPGVWYYIEWKLHIAGGTGGSSVVRVDGIERITIAGANTQATANATADRFRTANNNFAWSIRYDDLWVNDAQGPVNNDFEGDLTIFANLPNAEGATQNFTPDSGTQHFSRVNESVPDGDSSYVQSSDPGDVDLFAFPPLALPGSVKAVQVTLVARKDAAGLRQIAPVVKSGETELVGASAPLSTSYQGFLQQFDTDPDTDAAWTPTGVNSAQFGVKVTV
jgi:hypothetical protein